MGPQAPRAVHPTIREYLTRRVRWTFAVAFGGWLVIALSLSLSNGGPDPIVAALGFALFLGAILSLQFAVRCPKCSARLGQTIAMPLALSWGSGPRVSFCPYCGVNFDERCP